MIAAHVIQLLSSFGPIAQVVGSKIYDKKLPQPVNTTISSGPDPPYIIIRQSRGRHIKSFADREGTGVATFDVMVFHNDSLQADTLFHALAKYLDRLTQTTVSVGSDLITIKGIFQEDDEEEDWLPPVHLDEKGAHYTRGTFTIWHTEQR